MAEQNQADVDRAAAWEDIQRLEGWAGEIRMNLVRLAAIAVFYGRHLIEVAVAPAGSPLRGTYHAQVTWLSMMWLGAAVILHLCLTRRRVRPWLKYLVVGCDSAMITLLCILAGNPRTTLALLYFPLIASAPLRLSIRLVYFATACAIVGYLIVVGHYAWYVVGFHKYYATPELRIPRRDEAIVILAMLVTGFLCGQLVRQVHRISRGYPVVAAASPVVGNP